MAKNHIHRIHNAFIEFDFKTLTSDELKGNDFVDWAKKNVLETIDHHANNLTDIHTIIHIPEISIELNLNVEDHFFKDDEDLLSVISDQILSALKKSIHQNQSSKVSIEQYSANIVLEYIISGQINQYYSNEKWNDLVATFFEEIIANKELYMRWQNRIQNKSVFVRFFELVQISELKEFIRKWLGEKNALKWLTAVIQLQVVNPDYLWPINQVDFYFKIFRLLPKSEMSLSLTLQKVIRQQIKQSKAAIVKLKIPKQIEKELSAIFDHSDIKRELNSLAIEEYSVGKDPSNEKSTDKEKNTSEEVIIDVKGDSAYVGQAGLVLLAPFLSMFLKNLGYIDTKAGVLKQQEIPMLFHYIATGETTAPEWKLTLPKILSGLKPGQHCDTEIKSNKKLDSHINELLDSVIGHWEALKNTTPDGLRETFLIREGELKFKNGFYYLYIKEQTVDILLSYVSWNYTTIKLDWMQNILFVEWNKN
ncbi:contractile injection system tape measure protein [Aquimarina megaterium]|uniref:contractile injection system tape measure protein n=1 Tax=Aquimarina megaterium TaxID=1443666 RepID=UPI000471FC9E|nr:contractile injection system tape measure protein [Aquimarina megaterium]